SCQCVNPAGIAQPCFLKLEGTVLLHKLVALGFLRLDLVAVLHRAEMLPGVEQHHQEDRSHSGRKDPDLAPAARIRDLYYPRVIDRFMKIKFGCDAGYATPHRSAVVDRSNHSRNV